MCATMDFEIYKDILRIQKYVQFKKITEVQYTKITGEPYTT